MFANVARFANFQKFQLDNLVDFEKCCKTRIYYLLAKIGADTAENKRNFAKNWQLPRGPRRGGAGLLRRRALRPALHGPRRSFVELKFRRTQEFRQIFLS